MQKQEKFDFMANDLDLTEEQKEEFRKREEELDQAWYNEEINQNDLFDSYEQQELQDQEANMKEVIKKRKQASQPISKRQEKSADADLWEKNRMIIGGAMHREREELEDMEEEEDRVILMVHDIKPPFLDGRIVFTK